MKGKLITASLIVILSCTPHLTYASKGLLSTVVRTFTKGKTQSILNPRKRINSNKKIWSTQKPIHNASKHAKDHRREFTGEKAGRSDTAYVVEANKFVKNPPKGTLIMSRSNGDKVMYHPKTNTFATTDSAGVPRTMFKPKKSGYYYGKEVREITHNKVDEILKSSN